jgi:serine phosphatase RsbU (regulator of sigma subunit)/ligand-binding sensor domain-containing protein
VPFIKNYTTDDYHAHDQNWAIDQDRRGVLYVGNSSGLLEFDGVTWRLMELPNKSAVRSVKLGQDGIMYVGGQNFIGYVDTDQTGKTYVASLMDQVPKEVADFKDVWEILSIAQGIICRTRIALFIIRQKKLTTIRPQKQFSFLTLINNQPHVRQVGLGTFRVVNDQLVKVENLGQTAFLKAIALDHTQNLLVRSGHLHIYNGKTVEPFPHQLKAFLKKHWLYSVVKINEQTFALGTGDAGILIVNNQGKVLQYLHKGNGLQDNSVFTLYVDNQQNLWAGLSKGIAFIELNSPFSVLDESSGLEGSTYCSQIFNNRLVVGTSVGLFYKNWKPYESPINEQINFQKYAKINSQIWQIRSFKNQLTTSYNSGIAQLQLDNQGNFIEKKLKVVIGSVWGGIFLQQQANLLLIGEEKGLSMLEWKENEWERKHKIKGFSKNSRYVQEGANGNIWVSNHQHGAYQLTLNSTLDSVIKTQFYDKTKGFPSNTYNRLFKINGKNLFATENGVYVYDKAQDQMVRETTLNQLIGNHKMIIYLRSDAQQDIWYVAQAIKNGVKDKYLEVGWLQRQSNGKYQKVVTPFRKLRGSFREKIAPHLNPVDKQNILFATKEGMIHFAPHKVRQKTPFTVLLRKISLIGTKDSVIFSGTFTNAQGQVASLPQQNHQYPTFDYAHNSFRFNVSSTFYADNHKNEFRYRLEGLDTKWSPWTKETYKEYTNLNEGKYVLYVQTRNSYLQQSPQLSYRFKIYPPWYRTLWAYVAYVVLSVAFVIIVIRLYAQRLKQQKASLERKVQERTVELQQKHEEISVQRDFIEEKNQLLYHKNIQVKKSIEAAKLIQDAMLPFDDRMRSIFTNYFVVFRPRDIVSGDFYWANKMKDCKHTRLVAAIDCTGHGVPGAFMSMISYTLLNEIVYQQQMMQPSQILEKLRTELRYALQKEKTKNQSGMDIALCRVTYQSNNTAKVVFAGARRPMYYYTAHNQEFCEVKGSRISIGITTKKKRCFEEHELILNQGDLIFLTTDGYSDQNNEQRRSFGSNNLKKLLASNAELPLFQQQQILEKKLDDYMKNTTQRDDILVLGIKL